LKWKRWALSRFESEFLIEAIDDREFKDQEPGEVQAKGKVSQAYEWPEATRKYRLMIEGLDDDLIRHKAEVPDNGGDADQNIRKRERSTPAQRIRSAVTEALQDVNRVLLSELPKNTKAVGVTKVDATKILKRLTKAKGKLLKKLVKAFQEAASGGSAAGIERLNEMLRGDGIQAVTDSGITKILAEVSKQRAKFIVDSVIDDTVKRFSDGIDTGESTDQIARRLREQNEALTMARAEVIARTESAASYHDGQIAAWKQTGFVTKKHFLKAGGACQYCQAVENEFGEGKKSIPIDEPFVKAGSTIVGSKGGKMNIKRDMQGTVHPNCRCDFLAAEPER